VHAVPDGKGVGQRPPRTRGGLITPTPTYSGAEAEATPDLLRHAMVAGRIRSPGTARAHPPARRRTTRIRRFSTSAGAAERALSGKRLDLPKSDTAI